MARFLSLLSVVLISISCSNTVSDEELKHLTGYWEIEEVILPDGTDKEYKINPTIDYFEIRGKTGFRKKVMPQFDGSYRVNDLSEKISVTEEEGTTYISYVTDYAKWKEEIVELNDKELVLKNNHGMEYRYKKPEPFSVK
jgi:hypothetical protein